MRTLLLVGLVAFLVGCDTNKGKSVAPTFETRSTVQLVPKGYVLTAEDKIQMAMRLKVIYWCDYPDDMPGPPAPGHCRENGTDCTPNPPDPSPSP